VHVHAGYADGGDYDLGVVELMSAATALPVQLYEGGDLGYTDCGGSGELSYLAPYFHKVSEALSSYCMRPYAPSVCGLKLLRP
jgi:hypothetical protein